MKVLSSARIISLFSLLALSVIAVSSADTLMPDSGLDLFQIGLSFSSAPPQPNSQYGLAVADFDELFANTGISLGYLNMVTPEGWVVRNLPVDLSAPLPGLSVMFNLIPDPGQEIMELLVHADLSLEPTDDFTAMPDMLFEVGIGEHNAEGSDIERTSNPGIGVDLSELFFDGIETIRKWIASLPNNVEQDKNQCGPAAVANSLQWLEDATGIDVPDDHVSGIRDSSLVGKLDVRMQRASGGVVTSAQNYINGKLQYVDSANLEDDLVLKHKQRSGITWLNGDQTQGDATSTEDTSALSLIDWIIQEIEHGEDVEVRIGWDGGGGHYIDLAGAGKTKGVPWISWIHDAKQGDNTKGTGLFDGGFGFSSIVGNKIVCYIGGQNHSGTIDYATSESKDDGTKALESTWGDVKRLY